MTSSSEYLREPHETLQEIVARLGPILNPHGFHFDTEYNAVSSSGPFENGHYERSPIRIGLIVRGTHLGCPIYEYGKHHIGHNELLEHLGRAEDALLRFDERLDKRELVTKDGRDVVDALVADIEDIILPTILDDRKSFKKAVKAAHRKNLAEMGIK